MTLAVQGPAAFAADSGGGGEETLGNNLSVPAIFVPDTTGAPALRVACDASPQAPTGTQSTDGYWLQGTDATWSAYCTTAATATVTADWGANLKDSSALQADKPIRVEVGLLDTTAVGEPYQGYVVTNLTNVSDRTDTYGTDGTTFLSGDTDASGAVYSTRVWGPNTTLKITNVVTGAVVVNTPIAAEINSTGGVVYGFNWGGGDTGTTDPAGTYLLTFSVDPAVTIDAVTPGSVNQPSVSGPSSTSIVVTVGSSGGSGGGGGEETGGGVQITSPASTTFQTGQSGAFTVTTEVPSGATTASLAEVGTLPTGVTFKDNGNGTATLAGKPAAGTGGTYPLTIVAYNGTSSSSQTFTLDVTEVAIAPGEGGTGGGSSGPGYWMVASDGGLFAFDAPFYGSMGGVPLTQPVVGMARDAATGGYWMVARDGGVFAFHAPFYGSTGGIRLNSPVVSMAADPQTGGYWLVAADGGVFAFNAPFYGSTGGIPLDSPVVGMAATPSGHGYWLVAADGGVFAFGDAAFYGSMGGIPLTQPIVGMASNPATGGYRLIARDGGVFSFHAPFYGSMGGRQLNQPMVAITGDAATGGYWMMARDGGVFSFNAPFHGSTGGIHLVQPIVGASSAF